METGSDVYQWVGPETIGKHHPLPEGVKLVILTREHSRSLHPEASSVYSCGSPEAQQAQNTWRCECVTEPAVRCLRFWHCEECAGADLFTERELKRGRLANMSRLRRRCGDVLI